MWPAPLLLLACLAPALAAPASSSSSSAAKSSTTKAPTLTAPATSAPTPKVALAPPSYLPLSFMASSLGVASNVTTSNVTARAFDADVVARDMLSSETDVDASFDELSDVSDDELERLLARRGTTAAQLAAQLAATLAARLKATQARLAAAAAKRCLSPDQANATYISSLFYYGGAGTTVYLCQGATYELDSPIWMTWPRLTLATAGLPSGNQRATLKVTGEDQATAIFAAYDGANNLAIRNIQVDGSRPEMGIIYGGSALIEMGGTNSGQVLDNVKAFEPRGWSAVHIIEGNENSCTGAKITNNQIGPSGHAPSGEQQFRRRDSTGEYSPGQWADGISLACAKSTVSGNVITDATDGGIVIFGAPGSVVSGNTIKAEDRQLLGGINMVDWGPFGGTFEGTVVQGNTINSVGSLIKVGVALGGMVWGVDNRTAARTFGGSVIGNTFTSGPTGYFGYAIGMAGHERATIQGNSAKTANFGGVESASCFTNWFPLPAPQAFIADQWTTPGKKIQSGFTLSTLVLLICRGPGSILTKGSAF